MATVSCKNPSVDRALVIDYDFTENISDAIAKFGEDVVFSSFMADAKVGLQAFVRARLAKVDEDYMTDEEIIAEASQWVPGMRKQSDPLAKLQTLLSKLSPEQRTALLEGAIS